MTRRVDFDAAVRGGRRAARPRVVLHAAHRDGPTKVGFVVSRAVGGSVVRHRVQRRLRHVMRARLADLAPGTLLVVRAFPAAATATSGELAADVDALLSRMANGDSR